MTTLDAEMERHLSTIQMGNETEQREEDEDKEDGCSKENWIWRIRTGKL